MTWMAEKSHESVLHVGLALPQKGHAQLKKKGCFRADRRPPTLAMLLGEMVEATHRLNQKVA